MEIIKLCVFVLVVVHLPPQAQQSALEARPNTRFFSAAYAMSLSMNGGKSASNNDSPMIPEESMHPNGEESDLSLTISPVNTNTPTAAIEPITTTLATTTTIPTTTDESIRGCPDYTLYFLTVAQAEKLKATEYKTISGPFTDNYCSEANSGAYKSFSYSEEDDAISAYVYTNVRDVYELTPIGDYYIPVYMFSNTDGSCDMSDGSILHNFRFRMEKKSSTSISNDNCIQYNCVNGELLVEDTYWKQMGENKCFRTQQTTAADGPLFSCAHEWGAQLLTVENDQESDFLIKFLQSHNGLYSVDIDGNFLDTENLRWAKSNRIPKIKWQSGDFIAFEDYEEFSGDRARLKTVINNENNFQYVGPDTISWPLCTVNV